MCETNLQCDTGMIVKAVAGQDMLGYVAIDSLVAGKCCGGLRMVPRIDEEELLAIAGSMTLKYGLLGLPQGGAKAVVIGDPEQPEADRQHQLEVFGEAIAPILKQHIYVPCQDMGINNRDIRQILRHVGIRTKRRQLLDTPSGLYTAMSVRACMAQAANLTGRELQGSSIAIEGFGKVGSALAKMLHQDGARIVAISTSRGAIFAPDGLDVPRLVELACRVGSRAVEEYKQAERIDSDALLELDVDILSPCARAFYKRRSKIVPAGGTKMYHRLTI